MKEPPPALYRKRNHHRAPRKEPAPTKKEPPSEKSRVIELTDFTGAHQRTIWRGPPLRVAYLFSNALATAARWLKCIPLLGR